MLWNNLEGKASVILFAYLIFPFPYSNFTANRFEICMLKHNYNK